MSAQLREGTAPELALRSQLHALGLRYRVHCAPLPSLRRKADIVFSRARIAVFVDGCFWHGCPEHGRRRHEVNGWYWPEKIARNRARDEGTNAALRAEGWRVMRLWEHQLAGHDLALAAKSVSQAVRGTGGRLYKEGGAL